MSREILEKVAKGSISIDEAERNLKILAIDEIDNLARLDTNRELRKGIPEIILAEGKKPEGLFEIAMKMLSKKDRVIVSRADKTQMEYIKKAASSDSVLQVNEDIGMIIIKKPYFEVQRTGGRVGILTAGTSDVAAAEEAKVVAQEMGCEVVTAYDVGVAGIHRLLPSLRGMIEKDVDVIIAVAGREGALPSVVSGLVDLPVIAVPTSVGYGFGEKGVSALMAMLQACSLGMAVVNIDGGVAAGALAVLIANRAAKFRESHF